MLDCAAPANKPFVPGGCSDVLLVSILMIVLLAAGPGRVS
jgi:hypothetical protein